MDKRADAQGMWIAIVAALVVLGAVLLFPLFWETKTISENLVDYEICKKGNLGVVKTRLEVFDWVVAEQGVKHCRTEQVKVPKEKEYETVAKKMALCWEQYLEGKEAVFSTKDANYCAFCSVLEFKDKDKRLNGLSSYLVDNKPALSDKSYMEYLSEIQVADDKRTHLENLEINNINIDTSKKLAIMFVMYKEAYPGPINQPRTLTAAGGLAAGAVGGATIMGISYIGGLGFCIGTGFIGCLGTAALVAGAGGMNGYLIGADRSADWNAKIMVTEYNKQKLEQLKCTQLEGLDYLKIQKK